MKLRYGYLVAILLGGCARAPASTPGPPSHPALEQPRAPKLASVALRLIEDHPELLRRGRLAGRGPDFSPRVTRQMWSEMPDEAKRCSAQLIDAQLQALRQQAPLADRSFRNCQIAASRNWIRLRLKTFRSSVDAGHVDQAHEALGEALAGVQSFYTFTNYVELLAEQESDWEAAASAPARVWADGELPVDASRLLSHYSAIASPAGCGEVAPNLDKSTSQTSAGGRIVWGIMTAHEAAVALAKDDMESMLKQAYRDRPTYGSTCGQELLFGFIPWS